MFGGSFAPRGYALCNGQQLAISQNAALFSILGTSFGGNGQSTFALPDVRGRSPVHWGQGGGLSPYNLGQAGGTENTTLLVSNMPPHNHTAVTTVTPTFTPPTAATTLGALTQPTARQVSPAGALPTGGQDGAGNPVSMYALPGNGTPATMASGMATTTLTGGSVSATASTTVGINGGGIPFSTLQPYVAVTFIVALVGIFPTRN